MTETVFGAFGKIPSVGDFFRISAPNGFVQVWDEWLQTCLVSGAHTFGSRWDTLYMSVPIWRFTLSADLAGSQKVIGVVMPSVDRVGRRFPLTLMAPLAGKGSAALDHFLNHDLFEQLEDVALATLEDEASRDSLANALTSLSVPTDDLEASISIGDHALFMKHTKGFAATPSLLAAQDLCRTIPEPSIWSAMVEDDTRLMVCDGLPRGATMQGLFDLDADVWKADHP